MNFKHALIAGAVTAGMAIILIVVVVLLWRRNRSLHTRFAELRQEESRRSRGGRMSTMEAQSGLLADREDDHIEDDDFDTSQRNAPLPPARPGRSSNRNTRGGGDIPFAEMSP